MQILRLGLLWHFSGQAKPTSVPSRRDNESVSIPDCGNHRAPLFRLDGADGTQRDLGKLRIPARSAISAARSRREVQRFIQGHRNGGRSETAQTAGEKSEFEFLCGALGCVWFKRNAYRWWCLVRVRCAERLENGRPPEALPPRNRMSYLNTRPHIAL